MVIVSFKKHFCVLPRQVESCPVVVVFVSYAGTIQDETKGLVAESG